MIWRRSCRLERVIQPRLLALESVSEGKGEKIHYGELIVMASSQMLEVAGGVNRSKLDA